MIRKIQIPFIDANIQEVTITRWLCREGDVIRRKQPIAEMTTEKASFEFESPCAGTMRKILAPEKSIIPIGFIFAVIGDTESPVPDFSKHNRLVIEKYRAKNDILPGNQG